MNDLRDLYQEVVLDHGRHPRNKRRIEDASRESVGYNPLCGDKLVIFLDYDGETVRDVSFDGSGCAISQASASLLTESIKGKSREEAEAIIREFVAMVTGESDTPPEALGKLAVFSGVRDFPARVKCATLAWRTLEAAMHGRDDDVTTE